MKPIVYIETVGGVSYAFSHGDVEIVEIDWDNLNDWDNDPNERGIEIKQAISRMQPYTEASFTMRELVRQLEKEL